MDPRTTPYRDDLAADWLEGRVEATRFVAAKPMQVTTPFADMRRLPRFDGALDTQAVYGELVQVYEESAEGWAWGQLEGDGYVGYLPLSSLTSDTVQPTHRVSVPSTFTYLSASIKHQPVEMLPLAAEVAVVGQSGDFHQLSNGRFVWARHLAPIGEFADDFVAVCQSLLGVPYLWGGNSAWGLDCSGLVSTGLKMAGIASPRDSYMLEAGFGASLGPFADQGFQRGDLIFWKGHVGIMCDQETLLHCNGYHMQVVGEPLSEAVERIAYLYARPTSCRRPDHLSAAGA